MHGRPAIVGLLRTLGLVDFGDYFGRFSIQKNPKINRALVVQET